MKYSFQCPAPCNYEIKVDAQADDSSVAKKTTRSHTKALQNNCWFCDRLWKAVCYIVIQVSYSNFSYPADKGAEGTKHKKTINKEVDHESEYKDWFRT